MPSDPMRVPSLPTVSEPGHAPAPAPEVFTSPRLTAPAAGAPSPLDDVELGRLGDEIAELAAHLDAATARLLGLIREFDARGGWRGGFRSCAEWLSWRAGIEPGAAREKVRVARALGGLPRLEGALARGELSYSKVRAITRVATPETEADLVALGRAGTAAHVERVVRAWRRVDRAIEAQEAADRHRRRGLRVYQDEDGMVVVRGRLEPEVGAVLVRALEAAREALYRRARGAAGAEQGGRSRGRSGEVSGEACGAVSEERLTEPGPAAHAESGGRAGTAVTPLGWRPGPGGPELAVAGLAVPGPEEPGGLARPTWEQQQADALALVAETALAHDLAPGAASERYQVVVHVDAAALADPVQPGQSALEDGVRVSAETSRRLGCDATRVAMRHGAEGQGLDLGRRTRTIPPALRRALEARDGGCRFPGCGVRHAQGHHIHHWANGGPTRLDNLALLCRLHHRAVHEEGYEVERGRDGMLTFRTPRGRPIPVAPARGAPPADAAGALTAGHRGRGLGIGPDTGCPAWRGARVDLDWAIGVIHPAARAPAAGPAAGRVSSALDTPAR